MYTRKVRVQLARHAEVYHLVRRCGRACLQCDMINGTHLADELLKNNKVDNKVEMDSGSTESAIEMNGCNQWLGDGGTGQSRKIFFRALRA